MSKPTAELLRPDPPENTVVISMTESMAKRLMCVLNNEAHQKSWDDWGRDLYAALDSIGIVQR